MPLGQIQANQAINSSGNHVILHMLTLYTQARLVSNVYRHMNFD